MLTGRKFGRTGWQTGSFQNQEILVPVGNLRKVSVRNEAVELKTSGKIPPELCTRTPVATKVAGTGSWQAC